MIMQAWFPRRKEPVELQRGHLQRAPSVFATCSCAESENSAHVNTGVPLSKPVIVASYSITPRPR